MPAVHMNAVEDKYLSKVAVGVISKLIQEAKVRKTTYRISYCHVIKVQ